MSEQGRPVILVIDDHPEDQRAVFRLADCSESKFEIAHPEEVDADMLEEADLVLVDYDITLWSARNNSSQLGLKPENGIALAAVLREHTINLTRPTGFAIHTAEARQFSVTPTEPRAHLLARTHNLEWVFAKGRSDIVTRQAISLATAIRRLPVKWPMDDRIRIEWEIRDLLGLPQSDDDPGAGLWVSAAMRDITQCRPPLSEMVERNHGLLFVRWILQRILPYPCFLFDTHHLAVRLRVTHASLEAAIRDGRSSWLDPAAYRGVLVGFLGPRWWRAGVESLLWDLAGGSVSSKRLQAALVAAGVSLEPLTVPDPVVCIDQNYVPLMDPQAGDEVVRIVPDDWPPYAGQAWTTVALAREHPRLSAIVAEIDLGRLEIPKSGE